MARHKDGAPFSLFAFQDAITSVCGVVVLITLMLALELTRRVTDDGAPVENDARNIQETRDEIALLRDELETLVEKSRSAASALETASANMSESEARVVLQDARKRLENAQKEQRRLQAEYNAAKSSQDEITALETKVKSLTKEQNAASEAVADAERAAEQAKKENVSKDASEFYVFPENGKEKPWLVELARDRLIVVGATGSEQRQEFNDPESFLNWAKKRSRREEYFVLIARPGGVENFERIFDRLLTMDFRIGVELIGESKQLQILTK